MAVKFSKEEMFNLKINLVIIKAMYGNIKRHDSFEGDIHEVMEFQKPRYYRVLNGHGFRFTDEDINKWSEQLGIQSDYFTGRKRIRLIDVDDKMWEAYFKNYDNVNLMPDEKRRLEKLLKALDETTQRDFIYHYNINDAVYRIHYYFSHGEKYPEDNWQVKLDGLMDSLNEIKLADWEKLDKSKIEKYISIITKQNRYAQATLIYKTAE